MTVTDEQLAEWERLAEAATPEPWVAKQCFYMGHTPTNQWEVDGPSKTGWHDQHDAALIAAARSAVPALVAEIRRLRVVLGDWMGRCEQVARERDLLRTEVEQFRAMHANALRQINRMDGELQYQRTVLRTAKVSLGEDGLTAESEYNATLVRAEEAERQLAFWRQAADNQKDNNLALLDRVETAENKLNKWQTTVPASLGLDWCGSAPSDVTDRISHLKERAEKAESLVKDLLDGGMHEARVQQQRLRADAAEKRVAELNIQLQFQMRNALENAANAAGDIMSLRGHITDLERELEALRESVDIQANTALVKRAEAAEKRAAEFEELYSARGEELLHAGAAMAGMSERIVQLETDLLRASIVL